MFKNIVLHCDSICLHFFHSSCLLILIFSDIIDTNSVHVEQRHYDSIPQYGQWCKHSIQAVGVMAPVEVLEGTDSKEYTPAVGVLKVATRAHIQCCLPMIVCYSDAYHRHAQKQRYQTIRPT